MDTIIIAVAALLLGAWWAMLLFRQHDTESDDGDRDADDGSESLDGFTAGAYHPTGAEYWSRTHDGPPDYEPPAPGVCPTCETENDPFYTYCRNCTGRLTPA
ncbi:DUF7577 domain-containing protein [Natronococcus occultus]|uniref:DUF7577 domain-containing protein n=1 Tax=Natronococcus occultus SP4 TaxID=694430 RepID=L0K2B6_9EURY|nr:hypothetical protein [Natronococcus occultus]AGB38695.1 hypothetical protein Natoc_2940 [Natronococcus occultus SP4]